MRNAAHDWRRPDAQRAFATRDSNQVRDILQPRCAIGMRRRLAGGHVDDDICHPVQFSNLLLALCLELVAHRARGRRQLEAKGNKPFAAIDVELFDEPAGHDVLMQVGILDMSELGEHSFLQRALLRLTGLVVNAAAHVV